MLRRSRGAACLGVLLALGTFLATPGVVLAEDTSSHLMPILRMGVGARALAMGGAGVAACNDASGAYYNPAMLGWACGTQVGVMHALGMEADRRMSSLAASHRFDWGGLGASFITAGMSDIDERNEVGMRTGTFDYGDLAVMLHGAYATDMVSFGGTFKYLHQGLDANVETDGVSGIGFDFGVAAQPIEWVRLGVAARDVASSIGGDENADTVPFNLRGGVAIMPAQGITFGFDIDYTNNEDVKYHTGAEAVIPLSEDFGGAVRLGLNNDHVTLGLGVMVKMVEFAYTYMDEPEAFLGESHRIGVSLKLGEPECPFEMAPRPTTGGVATVRDRDQDGIPDGSDKCPTAAEDFDGFEDTDGCPDVDNDGDGILDVKDECPNRAEDFDGFQDGDGCPDVDNDGDGILDADDKCPSSAETFNKYEDTDGCPDDIPPQMAMANINFKYDSAEISGADPLPILDEIAAFMKRNPEVQLKVSGHTDSMGGDAYNLDLSKRRAETIRSYLVARGVSADRLQTEGQGEAQPIDTNDTDAGRARNRRIEFHLIP
jgi:outer membrane protein OmpA-like peptidoglycan-associated protein